MLHLYSQKAVLSTVLKLTFLLFIILPHQASSQTLASTTPQNKNFLIEKGTGHVCGSCPSITLNCEAVINSHPGRGLLIEYHFGPDAVPQAPPLESDFTTPYGDTIFDPAGLAWPFYLNMMVNRRDQGLPYGSTFIFGVTNQVQEEADTVVNQPSPVNLGMSSVFDSTTRILTVNVEAYYTGSSATPMNYIQIVLTEDSILATQYDPAYPLNGNFNPNFNHMNTFRANLNGFAGDTVYTTSMGTMVSRTYTYPIPAFYKNIPCNPEQCNLTFYMAEERAGTGQQSFTGKVITAIRTKVGSSSVTGVTQIENQNRDRLYPNPTTGMLSLNRNVAGSYSIEVRDLLGRTFYSTEYMNEQHAKIDLSELPRGLYLVNIMSAKGSETYKISLTY